MSVLGDGLRRVLGRRLRRPGTALVRVGPPRALPAPEYPVCPYCGNRHPRTLPSPWSSWSSSLLPDLGRPAPLRRQASVDERALQRDAFHPWRT